MVNNANLRRLFRQVAHDLKRHEGFREYAYPDPLSLLARKYGRLPWGFKPARELLATIPEDENNGYPWTVGYGFAVGVSPDARMTESMAARKLDEKMGVYFAILESIVPDVTTYPYVVQTVLLNMTFNMGQRLATFRNTLAMLRDKDYERAANNMEQSRWFRQTGKRAVELIERIRKQEIREEHLAK